VRTGLEADLLTLLIRQRIVDAYFPIQRSAPSTVICAFSGSFGKGDLMTFSTVAGMVAFGFSLIISHRVEWSLT
jgi:hypothetical protein